MQHIDTFFDDPYLRAGHLAGEAVTLTIREVKAENVGTDKVLRPVVYVEGQKKGIVFNKTNSKRVAALYGSDTAQWVGKRITIFPTTVEFAGEEVECIRVKKQVPPAEIGDGEITTLTAKEITEQAAG